jgi:hypothetical protein
MKRASMLNVLLTLAVAAKLSGLFDPDVGMAEEKDQTLRGRIVAVGVSGASAISPVGTFLPGGPIHDNPAFAAYTQPGRILDPARILVGSRSNFGAPVANPDQTTRVLPVHRSARHRHPGDSSRLCCGWRAGFHPGRACAVVQRAEPCVSQRH